MRFKATGLQGLYLILLEPSEDERGSFTRTFCRQEFKGQNLNIDFVQNSISVNKKRGTLRGMHYQAAPAEEIKLIQCMRGSVFDVVIDLRPDSPTFCEWASFELSDINNQMLYVPKGFAHGFQTLEDQTILHYMISASYNPELARGVRYDDPAFKISWPDLDLIIAEKDRLWPDFRR